MSTDVSGVPLGTEEGRAFFQDRLARFAFTSFCLSLFFYVGVAALAGAFLPNATATLLFFSPDRLLHAASLVPSLGVFVALRRRRFSERALVAADFAVTVPLVTIFAVMVAFGADPNRDGLTLQLIMMVALMARTVLIPSSGRRTAAIGLLCAVPVLASTFSAGGTMSASYGLLWTTATIVTTTRTSRLIFGLRRKAAEARRLGQYVLEEKLGEGGMGAVYRASHAMLRRPTAIKLLPKERAGEALIARFEREVQHTSMLTHPSTVTIFDYGRTPDGVFYYAMELLEGVDLQRLVEHQGPQDPRRVVHVLAQVCGSLAEAHERGLVHRDVKPANIMLCERGGAHDVAKVLDFGLVKEVKGSSDGAVSMTDTLLGTPLYMAPEALTSPDTMDGRGDLYAVGAVGYFMLVAEPVFAGQTIVEICAHHLHSKPARPSERLGHELPSALEDVLLACLAKRPDDRPSSARALRDALLACGLAPWTEAEAEEASRSLPKALSASEERDIGSLKTELAVDFDDRP